MIVGSNFIPIENCQLDLERSFIASDMEQEFLVPDWVARVPYNACAEYFLSKRNDNKWVHVPTSAGH